MKQALGLIIGLLVGATGALMFSRSLPAKEDSPEEQLEIVQQDLKQAQRKIQILQAQSGNEGPRGVKDGVRDIMQDIREGKDVSLDDVFSTIKPWMRQMAPLFDRMREINQEDWADNMTGEWSRKYDLSDSEQKQLREWFLQKNKEKAAAFSQVVNSDTSGFVDFVQATEYDWRDTQGIDEVMEGMLEGDELTEFREQRAKEGAERVQSEANRGLARLDEMVELDEAQQDQAFGILARGAEGYEVGAFDYDGMGADQSALDRQSRDAAIRNILRPEQQAEFDARREARRAEAEAEMRRVGLTLPKNWDLLEGDSF
ncbi:hypothetical protein [Haloferula sp.]|uniref:hypothetical protein n=1 Tax=Haloferula sp. TaxID=2497595 RepID=UPI003C75BDB4